MSTGFGALVGDAEKELPTLVRAAHDDFQAQLDELRTALPQIVDKAHTLVSSLAEKLITVAEEHLEALRKLTDPSAAPAAPTTPAAPADPTSAAASTGSATA